MKGTRRWIPITLALTLSCQADSGSWLIAIVYLMPIVEQFEQVPLLGPGEPRQPPVVEHQHVHFRQLPE